MKFGFAFVLLLFSAGINAFSQVGRWPLNNNVNDVIGSVNGVAMNSPTYSTSGKEGSHAIVVNGTNQYVDLGNPVGYPSGLAARTISAWAITNSTSGSRTIFAYGSGTTGRAMTIGLNGTSLIGGAWSNDLSVTNYWATGVWHHICLTFDGTTAKLYADGVQVASQAKSWDLLLSKVYIGRSVNNNNYWSGSIDDVRIYNTALTATQVLAIATLPPMAPNNVVAMPASPTSIGITWSDQSTNETGFEIERSLSSSSGFTLITTVAAGATNFNDSGLLPLTTYYYRIRSINAGGQSSYSSVANATTPTNLPTIPTNLVTTAITGARIDLSWTDASDNETGFEIHRSITSGSGFSLVTTSPANSTSFSDVNLQSNQQYYYKIRAINSSGQSGFTAESSATTLGLPPEPPTTLTASGASSTSILLNWIDQSGSETGFQVERSSSPQAGYSLIATTIANISTYQDINLANGTSYYYRVRAINAIGPSIYSNIVKGQTSIVAPNPPTSVTGHAVSASAIVLNWTDGASNEAGFVIERSLNESSGFLLLVTTSPNAVSYRDGTVSPNTNYYYRVKAINSGGSSVYAAVVTVGTPIEMPDGPTGAYASNSDVGVVTINWADNANNEVEFEIERASGGAFSTIGTSGADATTFMDTTVVQGATYVYRVKAINGGGSSSYSNDATIIIPIDGGTDLCRNIFCDDNGGVGIGTKNVPEGYTLAVKGKVIAEGVKVLLQSDWPDYVFSPDYPLIDLGQLKEYIARNGHLPNVPSEKTIKEDGIDLEKINVNLLEKIEELSLYLIRMESRIKILEEENASLKKRKK